MVYQTILYENFVYFSQINKLVWSASFFFLFFFSKYNCSILSLKIKKYTHNSIFWYHFKCEILNFKLCKRNATNLEPSQASRALSRTKGPLKEIVNEACQIEREGGPWLCTLLFLFSQSAFLSLFCSSQWSGTYLVLAANGLQWLVPLPASAPHIKGERGNIPPCRYPSEGTTASSSLASWHVMISTCLWNVLRLDWQSLH